MSSIWVTAICQACGEPMLDKDRSITVVPGTMREKTSYASGYGGKGKLRVMPSKGRKGQQKPEVYHEKCWPGLASRAGK